MSIDNEKVLQIIQDALNRAAADPAADTTAKMLWTAFGILADRRNDPEHPSASRNENLAAADHYLSARYMVASSQYSYEQTVAMTLVYEQMKGWAQWEARVIGNPIPEFILRSNRVNPTVRTSPALVGWGLRGAQDGEADRLRTGGPRVYIGMPPAFSSFDPRAE